MVGKGEGRIRVFYSRGWDFGYGFVLDGIVIFMLGVCMYNSIFIFVSFVSFACPCSSFFLAATVWPWACLASSSCRLRCVVGFSRLRSWACCL